MRIPVAAAAHAAQQTAPRAGDAIIRREYPAAIRPKGGRAQGGCAARGRRRARRRRPAANTGHLLRVRTSRRPGPRPAPCPGRGRGRRGLPRVPNLYCPRNLRRPPWQTHHPQAALARGSRSRVSRGRSARRGPVTEARLPGPAAAHSRPRAAAAPARARRPRSTTAGMCGRRRRPPAGGEATGARGARRGGARRPAAPGRGEVTGARPGTAAAVTRGAHAGRAAFPPGWRPGRRRAASRHQAADPGAAGQRGRAPWRTRA